MVRKSLLVGGVYFLLFSFLFFAVTSWLVSRKGEGRGWDAREKIALIRIEGVIADSKLIVEELHRYAEDESIKGILLRIDSPGGAVAPSQEIYDEVLRIREEDGKKVVTSMGTVAASGGYYIASATDLIFANPGTLTGSIGVIMELTNFQGLFEKVGLKSVTIKSGKNKDVGSPFREMKKEERVLLQGVLDDVHSQFIEAVSQGRSLGIETVRSLADGRVFTGRQAKAVGLIDELGSLEAAVKMTAELAGIEGEPRLVETKGKLSFFDLMRSQVFGRLERPGFPAASVRLDYLFSF
ncbi:MAG: signal peptide peptidase SppA [Nitrospiria bacterium]